MLGEFAQLMIDVLMGLNGFPGYEPFKSNIKWAEYGPMPETGIPTPAMSLMYETDEGALTSNRPEIRARYTFTFRFRFGGRGKAALPGEQSATNYADVLRDILFDDATIQGITPYIERVSVSHPVPIGDDPMLVQVEATIEAILNSRGGIWGYSNWGEFVWG